MRYFQHLGRSHWWWLLIALTLTCVVYWPGLSGGFLFDDYPNIVDNHGVQPHDAHLDVLVRAALSSPSSEFKRPLASLSFALNYLAAGLDPYWMKLTNLLVHLLNGVLVFLLTRTLMHADATARAHAGSVSALIAGGWLLLPINLTAVLYVVQRMESIANLFVLLGLIGYLAGRQRMLASLARGPNLRPSRENGAFVLCIASATLPALLGLLAKETAVMLPLYAALIEWVLFDFRRPGGQRDWRLVGLFLLILAIPIIAGLAWLLPNLLRPEAWAARNFTLGTRLLSEARIVTDYIGWVLIPLPDALSFYHDDFYPSVDLIHPWTTLMSLAALALLLGLGLWLRKRKPLVSLGILLFLSCHLLTATILPLELVYEHRNYFAGFGLLLALVPLLAAPSIRNESGAPTQELFLALPRRTLLVALAAWWTMLTALTANAWGNPLRLAEELAARAPLSPRAQYELGRTYIIYSHYDPNSPFTRLAYAPLERAAALPYSSILPQQALIFLNSRMHLPVKDAWWDSMIEKLRAKPPGVQDESSLGALTQCAREALCDLPKDRMVKAFTVALAHPHPSARLLATYGDYAWNILEDHALGERLTAKAVAIAPDEPAYRITLIRMLAAQGRRNDALEATHELEKLNLGGRLDGQLAGLYALLNRN